MAPFDRFTLASQPVFLECDSTDGEGFVVLAGEEDNNSSSSLEPPLEVVTICTPKPTKPVRKVTFSNSVSVQWMENKKYYPDEVKAQIWYNKKDFSKFRDSCRRIVDWISNRDRFSSFGYEEDEQTSHFCTRGLERFTPDGSIQFMERLSSMKNDLYVLTWTGARPHEIADLMSVHSAISVAEARERAREDAYAAKRHQNELFSSPTFSSSQRRTSSLSMINEEEEDEPSYITKSRLAANRKQLHPLKQSAPKLFYQYR